MKKTVNSLLRNFGLELKKTSSKPARDYWSEQKYLEKSEFKYVLWIDRVFQKIATVPGHIVELGVAYGRNTILFSHLIHMHNQEDVRNYYGFDTFDGYTENDLKTDKRLSQGAWKSISMEKVEERIQKAGNFKNYKLIKGDLLVTLPKFLEQNLNFRAALLYVDCNAYKPALEGMEIMKDFMSPGGIICIDEKKQGGETKALIEFCKKHNLDFVRDNSPFSMPAYTKIP